MAASLGSRDAGKIAEIVVTEGDPLEDITLVATQENIMLIRKDGKDGKTASNRAKFVI